MRKQIIIAAGLLGMVARAQDLPKHGPGDGGLDFEPKLMLDGPHAAAVADSSGSPEDRIQELQTAVTRAEARACDSEQLYKEGILAKVEVEERALAVLKAQRDLADTQFLVAGARARAARKSFDAHEAAQADLEAANSALRLAQEEAAMADGEFRKGQIQGATMDLQRKRKLYQEGVGSKREVEIAEDHLTLLTGTAEK